LRKLTHITVCMKSMNKSVNYALTLGSGITGLLAGIVGILKTIYWCYQTQTQERNFDLITFITLLLISFFLLGIGYTFIKVAKRL